MKLMLLMLAGAAALELIALFLPAKGFRKYCAAVALLGTAFASGGVVVASTTPASVLLVIASVYRVINMLRFIEARTGELHLRKTVRQASAWLAAAQVVILIVWWVLHAHPVRSSYLLDGLLAVQLAGTLVLSLSLLRHLRTTKLPVATAPLADRDLPTVTVAIPARNEDDQLEACLQAVLASDYPKLEVIVLDDCSQDDTPAIIRGFAHDGVRFVRGEEPDPNWLAKNQAYERLAEEASGDFIFFCGVDVLVGTHTIRELITAMLARHKTMLSAMPLNEQSSPSMPQIMRYMWELALPRRMFNRPPVLSSCWIIERKALTKLGGFAAVSRSIVPEAYFAKQAIARDGYSFVRSTEHLSLLTVKTMREQRATAVRMRYPQLHRRIELACFLSILELALLLAPFVLAIVGLWGGFGWPAESVAIFTALLLFTLYRMIEIVAFPHNRWVLVPNLPLAVLVDVALLNYSMWKYEFSEVLWKGRNVCVPAMHVIPHLPDMPVSR